MAAMQAKLHKTAIAASLLKLDEAWKDKDYYSVQQVYKSLYARYKASSKYRELREMLENGAIKLLGVNEVASASELASLLLDHYKEVNEVPSETTLQPVLRIFASYQPTETHPSKAAFIVQATNWSKAPSNNNQGAPELHTAFAHHYELKKDYSNAQKHYLRSDDMAGFAKMCLEWSAEGFPGEEDLFFTRPTLMLLALGNLKMANEFFASYTSLLTSTQKDVPLFNFCKFLLLTLERDALPLFEDLRSKYAPSLKRDPTFAQYLDQIASIFFGVKKTSNNGMGGLMGSLFKSLMSP
jgi:hypothetical protein